MDKRQLAYELRAVNVPVATVAERLHVSKGRVSQLVREYKQMGADTDTDSDGEDSVALVKARTRLLELQGRQLSRRLALEAGELIRADHLDQVLLTFLRHFEAQTDWIRQNRTGDHELLKAHIASVKGAQRECHANKIVEGCGIDG